MPQAVAPDTSRVAYPWLPQRRQRVLLCPHVWSLGLIRELQQARLLQNVCKEPKHARLGTEDFANQDEAQ